MGGFWALLLATLGLRSVCGWERTPAKNPWLFAQESSMRRHKAVVYSYIPPKRPRKRLGTLGNAWEHPGEAYKSGEITGPLAKTNKMSDSESATQTAQEDLNAAMEDSDSDFASESSSVVAITARLCETSQQVPD